MALLSNLVFLGVIHCSHCCEQHHCLHRDSSTSKTIALPPPPLLLLQSNHRLHHQKVISPICLSVKISSSSDLSCTTTILSVNITHRQSSSIDPLWQIAMKEELNVLSKNYTWDLVTLTPKKSVVGCKWIYKIKTRSNGFVE